MKQLFLSEYPIGMLAPLFLFHYFLRHIRLRYLLSSLWKLKQHFFLKEILAPIKCEKFERR